MNSNDMYKFSQDTETALVNSLEVFLYASRFQGKRVIICFMNSTSLEEHLLDIRLLQESNIHLTLFFPYNSSSKNLSQKFLEHSFHNFYVQTVTNCKDFNCNKLTEGKTNHIFLYPIPDIKNGNLFFCIKNICQKVDILKIIIIGEGDSLLLKDKKQNRIPHINYNELATYCDLLDNNQQKHVLLTKILQIFNKKYIDIILLSSQVGSIFKEIYTHLGSGTLLSQDYKKSIRRGSNKDFLDIFLILNHGFRSLAYIPITPDAILQNISNFYIYTINQSVIATAYFIDYGSYIEIGKIGTIPRYKGKGYARALIEKIINVSYKNKKKGCFLLTINPAIEKLALEFSMEKNI